MICAADVKAQFSALLFILSPSSKVLGMPTSWPTQDLHYLTLHCIAAGLLADHNVRYSAEHRPHSINDVRSPSLVNSSHGLSWSTCVLRRSVHEPSR